jgi:TonB family protein
VVVLEVGIDASGAVQDVTAVSGDSTLAKAAADAVRQWKYKPYLVEGAPVEIETQVTLNFHLASRPQIVPPPLGGFQDDSYGNEYFDLFHPLSREWVRETEVMRKRFSAANHSPGTYVLLTGPHSAGQHGVESRFVLHRVCHQSLFQQRHGRLQALPGRYSQQCS